MLSSMRGIGYARVSTDRHTDHGVSLEAQEAKIRAMATAQGATIIELIVDGGESAKDLTRPSQFSRCSDEIRGDRSSKPFAVS